MPVGSFTWRNGGAANATKESEKENADYASSGGSNEFFDHERP